MVNPIQSPSWLAGPMQRLRDISTSITSGSPYSPGFAASIIEDAEALRGLTAEFLRCANAYTSPLLRLSPELLYEIAAHVVELEPARPTELGWIRLGHVSCRFRSALLSMRGLWASAVCDVALHARQDVLARTAGAPISIHLEDKDEDIDSTRISFAMEHIALARRIKIEEFTPEGVLWTHEPRALSGKEFPFLEILDISVIHRPHRDIGLLGADVYSLEPLHAPRLQAVHLENIFVPFRPENLTRLSLLRSQSFEDGTIPNQDNILPSSDQFLDLLERCINVKHIGLCNMIPDLQPLHLSLRHGKSIRLPSLEMATISSTMSRLTALWSYLTPSRRLELDLEPDFVDFPVTTGGFVNRDRLSFLPLLLEQATLQSLHELAIKVDSENFVTQCSFLRRRRATQSDIEKELLAYSKGHDVYAPAIDVCFFQCIWDDQVSLEDFIDSIPEAFLAAIHTLDVSGLSSQQLRRLFMRLPRIRTLYLHAPIAPALSVLSSSPPADASTTSPHGYLPQLRHLRLMNPRILARRGQGGICLQEMLDIASSRANASLPLRSLKTEAAVLTNAARSTFGSTIKRLEEIVPVVDIQTS
ncbi:hypothetical protein PENSPDRAFT_657692 [Peniophora sp. CONT]|nr:hypothetical protein PENSPDRAFT_657692 [Peniophora sp. CONT]